MATQKFSDLTATTTPNAESVFAIAHSGSNFKLTITDLAANLPATTATSLTTSGNATIGGDLTITGDDLFMGTNTSGAALIADGTNFNPVVISGDLTISTGGVAAIGSGVIINADVNTSAAIDATKIHDGTISNTEFGYLNNVSSNIQTQLDAKASSSYVPTAITVADESTDTTCFPLFVTAATGDLPPKSGTNLAFNSSSGVLTATGFAGALTGNVTGNTSGTSGSTTGNAAGLSATLVVGSGGTGATSLTANGALIGNGTGAVTSVDMSTKGKLLAGDGSGNPSALSVGTNTHVLTADSGEATGLKWAATTAATPTVITVADESTDTTCFPLFVTAATGDLGPKSAAGLTFNAGTDVLSGTFAGNITGNVTGNTSGTSGSTTGNAAGITAGTTVTDIVLRDIGFTTNAIGSIGGGTQDINLTLGNSVSGTVDTGTTTFTFSNPTASDELCMFSLILTNGGSQTVNFPSSVDWEGGTAPTLTASGVDLLVFATIDGGTIWHGQAMSLDSKSPS